MSALYHPCVSDTTRLVDSYWEADRPLLEQPATTSLTGNEATDVAIIGGGYCGLAAALYLALRGFDVRVLEAGAIGWGASGRNGGFCSIGASFLGPVELLNIYGEAQTMDFYRVLIEAVQGVADLAREECIAFGAEAPGVWTFAHRASRLPDLEAQALIGRRLGVASRVVSADEFERTAFRCSEQFGALFEPVGFGLQPLAYCLGLASAAVRRGAHVHEHARVIAWERAQGFHRLRTESGSLRARRVIVAANGWLPEHLVPELSGRVLPIMSNITTTETISDGQIAAQGYFTPFPAANTRAHLSYIRMLPGQRLLFGGRGDTSGRPSGLRAMQRLLERRRGQIFPAFAGARTSHSWRGLIAATRRGTPAIGLLPDDPSIGYAFGCHGNGVAFMTWAGRTLGRMMAGETVDLPAPLVGLPERFPAPSFRLWYLRMMLLRAQIEDKAD
jgi:glycine/D-amino acid oxidase-like deaminating enzyme